MERINFRPELHIAQQSRREKLRVLQHHDPNDLEVYSNNLDQYSGHDHQGLISPDLVQLPSLSYNEPTHIYSSEMLQDVDMVHHQDSTRTDNYGNYQELIRSTLTGGGQSSKKQYGGGDDMYNLYHNNELLLLPSHQETLSLSLSSSVPSSHTTNMGGDGNSSANFAHAHCSGVGPLGPFTGYATILKSSKYLRPAQQLLDGFCNVNLGTKLLLIDALEASSDEISCSGGGGGLSSPNESCRPELFLQKKAKLMYMQEEVCRRYKHYHQQMQMAVSSFETVAGLSAATPYISLALKAVSRHFRFLKNAISELLEHVRKDLGEDLSSLTTTTTSSSKGETTIQKQKGFGGGNLGFFEPQQQQHVWRPQRGLPERAVAILRAWLFDHFLHPYPTDADKHILATQTGLTRNQVSNWFINARVRVWKPMVEEIHTLETKATPETGSSAIKTQGKATTEGLNPLTRSGIFSVKQPECSEIASSAFNGNRVNNADTWNHEKRSRLDCRMPGPMDTSLVGFMPCQQSDINMGGLGAVSLTLGLRQNAEGVQQQYPLQQQENQLMRHFGDHIIYDFVG